MHEKIVAVGFLATKEFKVNWSLMLRSLKFMENKFAARVVLIALFTTFQANLVHARAIELISSVPVAKNVTQI